MAAKFFTGLPLDGPDPECVKGHGESALAGTGRAAAPRPSGDHSHRTRPVPVSIGLRPVPVSIGPRPATESAGPRPATESAGGGLLVGRRPPDRACDEDPLAGFIPGGR